MAATFQRYGETWKAEADELTVELTAISLGGSWKGKAGQVCGLGLFEHMMNARKLLWPGRYRHRWTDLIYKAIIKNIVTILMGPGSSQKTSHAAEFALIDYWAHPNDTLILISTTTTDKLDLAIYGEVKMLFEEGKDRYEWLAGHVLESKRAITTDDIETKEVRDIRKGFIGRACFSTGTLVDTPSGPVPIEALRVGDRVINAFGVGRVRETVSRVASSLVRVQLADGRQIDCTPEHPFFTLDGWKKAMDLQTSDLVLSGDETLSVLRLPSRSRLPQQKVLFSRMPGQGFDSQALPMVRRTVPAMEAGLGPVLQRSLRGRVGSAEQAGKASQKSLPALRQIHPQGASPSAVLLQCVPRASLSEGLSVLRRIIPIQAGEPEQETLRFLQSVLLSEREEGQAASAQQLPNAGGDGSLESVSGVGAMELFGSQRHAQGGWSAALVQDRLGFSGGNAGRGDRRRGSPHSCCGAARPATRGSVKGTRVESVTVLQQSGDSGYSECEGGYRVHNLEVAGHPSYSVNGVIVHNCYVGKQYVGLGVYAGVKQKRIRFIADELQFMQSTFFDCLPNMFQSAGLDATGDPDVKIIGSGNPKHDPYDQLSMAAEPELGWSSVGDVTKTSTWATKFHRGECVNLIGLDSPNMDVAPGEKPPFPRLISRNTIAVVEKRWGKNSMQFYSQCVGKMMMNMVGNRVITKDLCEQHRAFETAVWRDSNLTRIGFLDPAWGGASSDRCVWGWLEFGTELEGREVIRFGEYLLVPFAPKSTVPPDDQIAAFVKQQAKLNGIEPRDIFYDSTGRGTTGAAFARVFGMEVPVPVAFGDRCSPRPVRHDLFVEEPDGTKRLKRCDEEYGKFVTELWFAARNVIECDQMRELPEEVAREGYMREYTLTKGNKYDVEPKEDTRDRMGCSPDLFDAYVVGIEGARQRGFSIGRLGYDLPAVKGQEDWFEKEAREYREAIKNKLLKHR